MNTSPSRFIDEPIEVYFEKTPFLKKKPICPSGFRWRERTYPTRELLAEWVEFQRHGRAAPSRGSWGVGRYTFIVKVDSGQIFEIYYDRAPKDAGDRQGSSFLLYERKEE